MVIDIKITTKHSIGDKVYVLRDDKVIDGIIEDIYVRTCVVEKYENIEYLIKLSKKTKSYFGGEASQIYEKDEKIYLSEEDVVKSLFN